MTWSVLRAVYAVWGFGAGCCWVAAQGPVFGGGASVYPRLAALRRLDAYAVVHVPHALIRIVVNGDAM
eukprot:COSAG01_NODE_4605_length_4884_cov_10.307210_3_plen_68_part_00